MVFQYVRNLDLTRMHTHSIIIGVYENNLNNSGAPGAAHTVLGAPGSSGLTDVCITSDPMILGTVHSRTQELCMCILAGI